MAFLERSKNSTDVEKFPIYMYCLNFIHPDTNPEASFDWNPTKTSNSVEPRVQIQTSTQVHQLKITEHVTIVQSADR